MDQCVWTFNLIFVELKINIFIVKVSIQQKQAEVDKKWLQAMIDYPRATQRKTESSISTTMTKIFFMDGCLTMRSSRLRS
ncbi:unnamed protein product [Caenorhabditis nigoni]